MHTTYHLNSAQDINPDILEAIKAAFKSNPITITVEVDEAEYELTDEMKNILDQRLAEGEESYISSGDSVEQIKKDMAFNVIVSKRAQEEIELAIDFYAIL